LLDAGADPQLSDVQVRDPIDDEVLVRIDAVGICHYRYQRRRAVAAVGPRAALKVGQPVALTFANCGRCAHCASNNPAYCERSTDLNMRGDRGDEASAFSRDGSPIAWSAAKAGQVVKQVLVNER
jgi:aryl-alcohol dehydrogenase